MSATVRQNASGNFFVSLVCEVEKNPLPQVDAHIGIDLGLKEYAVCSNGERYANPRFYRQQEKTLALWQRRMARRTPGGSNWKKAKQHVALMNVLRINEMISFIN